MNVLYVGQAQPGSTSKMRAEMLNRLLTTEHFDLIDLAVPLHHGSWISKSLGWRFFKGPLITNVARYVAEHLPKDRKYDLVWVDKGLFLNAGCIQLLRSVGEKLVHYTPDASFLFNKSDHFVKQLPLYDVCVTTKSFELDQYRAAGARKLLFCTQGYDHSVHRQVVPFAEKNGVVFVGLAEPLRIGIIQELAKAGVPLKVGGFGWKKALAGLPQVEYLGERVMGADYSRALSGGLMALGLLSKRFPEQHTTRTFEIPACGTALVTEDNPEIRSFYKDDEVIFFKNDQELLTRVQNGLADRQQLADVTARGKAAVEAGCYNYECILKNILREIRLVHE